MNWLSGSALIATALIGLGCGLGLGDLRSNHTAKTCAQAILKQKTDGCPAEISLAITQSRPVPAAPVVKYIHDAQKQAAQTAADIQTLQQEDVTNACGSTPAFVDLRQQLCRETGDSCSSS